jgi:hypothetical protein
VLRLGSGNEVQDIQLPSAADVNTTGNFVMFYLNDQIAGQSVDVQYDPDPDQMVSKIQQGLNSLFGLTGATPNFKARLAESGLHWPPPRTIGALPKPPASGP